MGQAGYRILIVDDDRRTVKELSHYFTRNGLIPVYVPKDSTVLGTLRTTVLDAVVMAIGQNASTTLLQCRHIKMLRNIPVILLSTINNGIEKVDALKAGADDYLIKPFALQELYLLLHNQIRARTGEKPLQKICCGDLCIDPVGRTITYGDTKGKLTAVEFNLLAILASQHSVVLPYDLLYDMVWHAPIFDSKHNLQVHIATLRQKLRRLTGRDPIRTISRTGYYFDPEGL